MSEQVPPVAVVIVHKVEDFDKWKVAFDAHADTRKGASALGHHINRGADDPNLLAVYIPATNGDAVKAMVASDDLKAKMQEAGVAGPPTITFMTPVAAELDMRDTPGCIVTHKVKDFDSWKAAYDKHADARKNAGITGGAVNRNAADANEVIVYMQADSHDALKAFIASDDLKAAMQEAGVEGAPDITFWNGGHWGEY
jgi:hypothetical protein